jgi:hypothetical protein
MTRVPDDQDPSSSGPEIDRTWPDIQAKARFKGLLGGGMPAAGTRRDAVEFPDWFPENIREVALDFRRHAAEQGYDSCSSFVLAMVERLIHDPRMKTVWTQLLQKKRPTESRPTTGFRLAANLATVVGRKRAEDIHPASAIVVFRDAFAFGVECIQFAEGKRTHYLEQAQGLRSDASFLKQLLTERRLKGLAPREVHRMAKQFDNAANVYQMLADRIGDKLRPIDPEPFDPDLFDDVIPDNPAPDKVALTDPEPFGPAWLSLINDEVAKDEVPDEVALTDQGLFEKQMFAKYFALKMAATIRDLFGTGAMYGTVATITGVALDDQEITDSAVREWCERGEPSPGARDNEKLVEQLAVWRHMPKGPYL